MTNTDTADVPGTIDQAQALALAGSELVRVTVNNDDAAAAVPFIVEGLAKRGIHVPIVGDFHYNGHLLLKKFLLKNYMLSLSPEKRKIPGLETLLICIA